MYTPCSPSKYGVVDLSAGAVLPAARWRDQAAWSGSEAALTAADAARAAVLALAAQHDRLLTSRDAVQTVWVAAALWAAAVLGRMFRRAACVLRDAQAGCPEACSRPRYQHVREGAQGPTRRIDSRVAAAQPVAPGRRCVLRGLRSLLLPRAPRRRDRSAAHVGRLATPQGARAGISAAAAAACLI